MSDAPLILGVSGLRGIVGESLTPEVAVRYAGAFGTWLQTHPGCSRPRVGVAFDGRSGGHIFSMAAASGLAAVGCEVHSFSCLSTPSVGVAVDRLSLDGAIQVTASHNPQEWNGLKCIVWEIGTREQQEARLDMEFEEWLQAYPDYIFGARAPSADEATEIVRYFQESQIEWSSSGAIGSLKSARDAEVVSKHLDLVLDRIDDGLQFEGISAVADSVNASGAPLFERLTRALDVRGTQLFGNRSGVFPHTPEPTKENLSGEGGLCDAVPGLKADVGFAQDPDADRLAIVDELGNYIGEEYTLVLCAAALMEGRRALGEHRRDACATGEKKPVFVVNLSTSRMIDDVAAHYGAEVVRTAVGEANVVERMKALTAQGRDVVMGGEGNGGVIWAEVTYVRDSLSAMALTLSLMARTGKSVSELVKMIEAMGPGRAGYAIIKKKADLASKADAVPVVEHLAEVFGADPEARVDTQDGVRVDWDGKGVWAHVRASNTEAIMRVIVEAPTGEMAEATAAMVEGKIAEVRS